MLRRHGFYVYLSGLSPPRKRVIQVTDISHYGLLFGFFLLYKDCVPFELVDSAALL
jgi:hypothetical protein